METITVTNPTRRRSWGWNYSTQPGQTGLILVPERPDYVGSIAQVRSDIAHDRNYAACRSGGTHLASAWFYGNRRVLSVRYLDGWMSMTDALNLGLFDSQAPFHSEYSRSVTLRVIDA